MSILTKGTNQVHRFLFEDLDIRGAFVHLDDVWSEGLLGGRNYPPAVIRLLGELTAVTTLMGAQRKSGGRITFQLRGDGPISMLVLDCSPELGLRGMARHAPVVKPAPVDELLGGGHLMMTLDLDGAGQTYQSFVPLHGDTVGALFEHFLAQSEQQPTRLFLAADGQHCAGLFLQKLPDADQRDADGWDRVTHLAATLKDAELLGWDCETLLRQLFHEETVRLFPPREIVHDCPEDWQKVRAMLLGIGRQEVEAILAEHGEVRIQDEICNRSYHFSAEDVATLFDEAAPPLPPTLH